MMYIPDKWVVVKITNRNKVIYKVLATWEYGNIRTESWRLNSGITHCEFDDDFWYFYGESGSVYKCQRNAEGLSGYILYIYNSLSTSVDLSDFDASLKVIYAYSKEQ